MHLGRSKLVFGRGNPGAKLVFVGDFPSDGDDADGKIFSDEAGALLHKMILAMRLQPDQVYLVNLLQCRPPKGSRPGEKEILACGAHFRRQLELIRPTHVVALGQLASRALTRTDSPLLSLRKQSFELDGARLQCTHHPRELLAAPSKKKEAWDDLQSVMRSMGLL
jgi:DNA polymerase